MTYNTVTIHDETVNKPVTVGWDMCGTCSRHISRCRCYDGPTIPSYIVNWNGEAKAKPLPVTPAKDSYVMPEVTRAERHPVTGRKVRADRGVKRGPQSAGIAPTPAVQTQPAQHIEKPRLSSPCALHTAESRLNNDGSYTCSIDGCQGVV